VGKEGDGIRNHFRWGGNKNQPKIKNPRRWEDGAESTRHWWRRRKRQEKRTTPPTRNYRRPPTLNLIGPHRLGALREKKKKKREKNKRLKIIFRANKMHSTQTIKKITTASTKKKKKKKTSRTRNRLSTAFIYETSCNITILLFQLSNSNLFGLLFFNF
jgi:hypothetical protein